MSKSQPLLGDFRITHMDQWDQDFVDEEVEGFIRFDKGGSGEFQFGYVSGSMDCEQTEREGKPAVEWSWEGNDEMETVSGRGWAVLLEDGSIRGRISIHDGDASGFTAVNKAKKQSSTSKKPAKTKKPSRKVQAKNAETGEEVEVELESLHPGQIRHESLPEPLLRRIKAIHSALKGVYDQPLEQMEINFMRDGNPEREVALFERIVVIMAKARKAMPKVDGKVILKTLLVYSMGAMTEREIADPVVKKIVKIAEEK